MHTDLILTEPTLLRIKNMAQMYNTLEVDVFDNHEANKYQVTSYDK